MAYSYIWPSGLPQCVRTNYTETQGVLLLRTPMDAGPAKMRRRGQKPTMLNVTFTMSNSELSTLENFAKNTVKGTARFGFPEPRSGNIIEVRFSPSGDGDLYSLAYLGPNLFTVSMTLEVLP